jgi:hypothetical protein
VRGPGCVCVCVRARACAEIQTISLSHLGEALVKSCEPDQTCPPEAPFVRRFLASPSQLLKHFRSAWRSASAGLRSSLRAARTPILALAVNFALSTIFIWPVGAASKAFVSLRALLLLRAGCCLRFLPAMKLDCAVGSGAGLESLNPQGLNPEP